MLNSFLKNTFGERNGKNAVRNRYLFLFDLLFVVIAYIVAAELVFTGTEELTGIIHYVFGFESVFMMISTGVIFVALMYIFGIYNVMWTYGSTKDYLRVIFVCIAASAISVIVSEFSVTVIHDRIPVCAVIAESFAVIASRMFIRAAYSLYREHRSAELCDSSSVKNLLIVGAGNGGIRLFKDIRENIALNYNVIGFVDDDYTKKKMKIDGKAVLGNRGDIKQICTEYAVDEIIIAIPSASSKDVNAIFEVCNQTKAKTKILPGMDKIVYGEGFHKQIRNVQIEDLLEREPIKLNNEKIERYITNKTVLVTGGGGSIGSELCRQIMRYNPSQLVIMDIYENNAYDIQMELNRKYPDNKPEVIIASVRDVERLDDIFDKYRPYIVFHAAAHKHVPLMEDSPMEAIKNNVFGTLNTARCADKFGVSKFVLISTDKAVNPTNVMGATKRICEMIIQYMQQKSKTTFVAVRFGNVLGSNGSVIPLFKKQIEAGGPVTVTDKRITRFFMTIPEAAQLVLQAASYAEGGEIFVLDMGEPVKIYDLARNIIKLSGMVPDKDIKIEICGLRPGEKLYEELLMDEEGLRNTEHAKIFIGQPIDIEYEKLKGMLDVLKEAAHSNDVEQIKDLISDVVPTYVRNNTATV